MAGVNVENQSWAAFFGGDYMNADTLLAGDLTLTIDSVSLEEVEDKDKKLTKNKLVIYWQEHGAKPWIPCKTSAKSLSVVWGDSLRAWKGRKVTLFRDPTVKFGSKTTGGIRVRGMPDLPSPVSFEFAANTKTRPKTFTLIPTSDALALWCHAQSTTLDLLAAYITANPVPRGKDRAPLAELPPEADRAAFVQFLSSPRGQQWSQNLQRAKAQTTADDGGEGEE